MGRHRTTGAKLGLPEPLAGDLADFCAASWGPPECNIVQAALRAFIDEHLSKEPELRKRYEDAKAKRRARRGDNIIAIPTGK